MINMSTLNKIKHEPEGTTSQDTLSATNRLDLEEMPKDAPQLSKLEQFITSSLGLVLQVAIEVLFAIAAPEVEVTIKKRRSQLS